MICSEQQVPAVLYHYTSLEVLAQILEYRTLRFTPLTKMDDPQEAQTLDAPGMTSHYYASCWTDSPKEDIPMWKLYASLDSGVRIEMAVDPFVRYEYSADELRAFTAMVTGLPTERVEIGDLGGGIRTLIPLENFNLCGLSRAYAGEAEILYKVKYVDDVSMLKPKVIHTEGQGIQIDGSAVGRCKNTYWKFQSEWRYLLGFMPVPSRIDGDDGNNDIVGRINEAFDSMLSGKIQNWLPYYDMHIRTDAIAAMRVVPSPKMSDGNRILLSHLLEHHGIEGCIQESALTGLL